MVAAIEQGVVLEVGALGELVVQQLRYHAFRFVFLIARLHDPDRVAETQLAPQAFLEDVRVVADQGIGGLEYASGGAVVLFQLDDLEIGEVALQVHQVFRLRAAPGVDRLIVVAHHRQGVAWADDEFHQFVLTGIGVLVFIHQQVVNAVLPLGEGIRVGLQQAQRLQDQVVEVQGIAGQQVARVFRVDKGGPGLGLITRRKRHRLLRRGQGVFPGGDLPLYLFRRTLGARRAVFHQFTDEGQAVIGVEDGKTLFVAQQVAVAPQYVEAEGVKGRDGEPLGLLALEQGRHARLHFARRLVGEGHGSDARRRDAAFQQGDFARDHRRLATAGAGEHQQRTADVAHGFFLSGIQF